MPYTLKMSEKDVLGPGKFVDGFGHTECVSFVQQAANAPVTKNWSPGIHVMDVKPGQITRGTAIATFDEDGRYPLKGAKHAAIYLSQDSTGIQVLDQWKDKGKKGIPHEIPGVSERKIYFGKPEKTRRSNRGEAFYIIELKKQPGEH
jgi:hypothetical protein